MSLLRLEIWIDSAFGELGHRLTIIWVELNQYGDGVHISLLLLRCAVFEAWQPLSELLDEGGFIVWEFFLLPTAAAAKQIVWQTTQTPTTLYIYTRGCQSIIQYNSIVERETYCCSRLVVLRLEWRRFLSCRSMVYGFGWLGCFVLPVRQVSTAVVASLAPFCFLKMIYL